MNKKLFSLILVLGMLVSALPAKALIALPFFNVNINEIATGGDDTFAFHVSALHGNNPVPYFSDDIAIATDTGTGSDSTGGITNSNDQWYITQNDITGWQAPTVTCSSNNNSVTYTPTTRGVIVTAQTFSSITCTFTNSKTSSKTPVLIVPGVLGTDISKDGSKLWLDPAHNITSASDNFMDPLQFNTNLTPSDTSLSVGNVVSKVGPNFYSFDYTDGLINEFKNQGYTEGTGANDNLFLFPYDWRYGVSDSTEALFKQKIADIMSQTGSDKVDVVAHSTGGLIVKKYVADNESAHHIGKAIFVGVPNTGAPKAIKVLLQGDNFSNPFLSQSEMQKLAKNFPVVYDLAPSSTYYDKVGSFVTVIKQKPFTTPTSKDLSFSETNSFLTTDHSLNSTALSNAQSLHSTTFDAYDMRTAGVDVYAIDGCKAGTIGKVIERNHTGLFGDTSITYDQPFMVAGDGTVPFVSANNLPIDTANKYFALQSDHGKMPSQNGIRQEIVNLISGSTLSTKDTKDRDLITQDISKCVYKGKIISIYSPVDISATDIEGNTTGIASDGSVINDIPNADIEIMGDHKFLYLPDDDNTTASYSIGITGTGNGTFTLKNQTISGETITGTEVFSNIAVTTSTKGTISLGSGNTATTIALDKNGDGSTDVTISPTTTVDQNKSIDILPPVTTATISGTKGVDGYYRSSVSVTLSATDPVVSGKENQTSGVLKTVYKIDNGDEQTYTTTPISITTEGAHTITFFSTDQAGNNEDMQTLAIVVDKTAPEISAVFNVTTKDIDFTSTDNISTKNTITLADDDDTITATDQAGNKTIMKLQDKDRKHKLIATIKSLSYNGTSVDISKNALNFYWKLNKNNSLNKLEQYAKNKKEYLIHADYITSDNTTKISGKDKNGKVDKTITGLALLKISTDKGDLVWGY